MKLTRFDKLLREVEKLGASQVVANLIKSLSSGHADIDPDDIVFGEHGLFLVDENGCLTRVIVHIVDIRVDTHYFPKPAKLALDNDEFHDDALIKKAHKYHLLNCQTLRQASNQGWRDKYKMSQKKDGTFYYRFLAGDKVYKENNDQVLQVCGYCLNELNKKHESSIQYKKSNFLPEIFFSEEFRNNWLNDSDYKVDTKSVPNVYQQDWKEISSKYKNKVNYQCEGDGCRYSDLSSSNMRKYLHCHHVNMEKSDNNYSNLKALCLACHAEQPNHGHMKNNEYTKYVSMIDNEIRKYA